MYIPKERYYQEEAERKVLILEYCLVSSVNSLAFGLLIKSVIYTPWKDFGNCWSKCSFSN